MKKLRRDILVQLLDISAEPLMVVRVNHPDWPVAYCNGACESIAGTDVLGKPFADVVESLMGRELAVEISETLRGGYETSIPFEHGGREYLLFLKPLKTPGDEVTTNYGVYWRDSSALSAGGKSDMQQALLKAKRRIRDLTRDDPATGLLNARAFRDVLARDWAVAAREKTSLALVAFTLDEFPAYIDVFGRHAADSCLRRVAQAIRRCLRRASDVAARVESADSDRLVVLAHSSNEEAVTEFAGRISEAVRKLGLHHPRSSRERFVTVSFKTRVIVVGEDRTTAAKFLDSVLK
jgi:diguanylate cyclase (GGDEF)-like protein